MTNRSLKIGEKTARLPFVQGGMGIGISLGNLAGTVAKEGGVGMISAAQIGFREPDFDADPLKANLRAMVSEYEKARALAPEGVIGFNIMVAMAHYEEYVKTAVAAEADLIVSGAGLPVDLPAIAGETKTALAPIVSTRKSADVILKFWHRKYKRVPDLMVIEGPLAGGHLGFTREQLAEFDGPSYDEEVGAIIQVVREYEALYGRKIPIALAGGIENRQQAEHAFSLGADAIQVATRLITTWECDMDIRSKEAYLSASPEDIVIVKSPVGMPGRALKNAFLERVLRGEVIPHRLCHGCLRTCRPAEIPYCITDALIHGARGEVEDALLFCGARGGNQKKMETVRQVIASLMPEEIWVPSDEEKEISG